MVRDKTAPHRRAFYVLGFILCRDLIETAQSYLSSFKNPFQESYFVPEDYDEFQSPTLEPVGWMPGLLAGAGLVASTVLRFGIKTPHWRLAGSDLYAAHGVILGSHQYRFAHGVERRQNLRVIWERAH